MQLFQYQPYYQYNGPDKSDPFREELTSDKAERNIELFFDEIRSYFSDIEATFERKQDWLTIRAPITERECDESVKHCLNSLDLFANKL